MKFYCLLFFLSSGLMFAQDNASLGVPFVHHFNTHEMGYDKKTWDITQNQEGILYFANGTNVLEYDGERWNSIYNSDFQVKRTLNTQSKDTLYLGMDGDYGFLAKQQSGDYNFTSLFSFNPELGTNTEEFWKSHKYKGNYIFQTFRNLYIYDGKLTTKIPAHYRFKWSYKVGNNFYVNDIKYGVFVLQGTNLDPVVSDERLNDKIIGVTELNGEIIIITDTEGLFFVKDGALKKWEFDASNALEKSQIFSFLNLKNGDLALGTVSNGLYVIDASGRVKTQINKSKGLQNNTILTIFEDNERNLWLGLDFGLDHVKINSNLTYTFDYLGDFGSVYAAQYLGDKLILGTNQGLYSVGVSEVFEDLGVSDYHSLLSGQVWNLKKLDNTLWVGHDTGTYTYDGQRLEQISNEPGSWNFSRVNDDFLVSGNYNGISIFKKEKNTWNFHKKIEGFSESGRFVEVAEDNTIFVSINSERVYQLEVDFESGTISTLQTHKASTLGFKENFVGKVGNDVVITGLGKALIFDTATKKLVPYLKTKEIPKFANGIIQANNQTWFLSNTAAVVRTEQGQFNLEDIGDRLIYDVMKVFPLNASQTLIPIYNGFSVYTNAPLNAKTEQANVLVRSIGNFDGTKIYRDTKNIPYSDNDINIVYSQPVFGHETLYQTRLNDGDWSTWNKNGNSVLLNLKEGSYTFEVRAKTENRVTNDHVEFNVIPPFSRTKTAYILYFLFFSLVCYCLYLWNRFRLKKQEEKLSEKRRISLQQQQQKFQIEQNSQKQRIIELENAKLQEEVQNKSRELTQVAHVNMNKNKILKKIKDKFIELQDKTPEKMGYQAFKEMKRYIEYYITDKDNELFTINFDKSHQDFYSNLSEKYPMLTPKDLRLCAYLRINLSSKEIAPLLGISSQSVDVSRHRLRKKMNLVSKDNLTSILASFS